MVARIYKPAKTAMQSGFGNTKGWVLDFEPEAPRRVEPLMGWTSSSDMRQQLRLRFDSKEEAVAWARRAPFVDGQIEVRQVFELEDFNTDATAIHEKHRDQLSKK